MKKKLIAAALAAAAVITATAGDASATHPERTLADILLADSSKDDANGFDRNWFDYDLVTQAVLAFPDLTAAASNPDAELTVFLPNDRAFRRLVADLTGTWPRNEKATFDAVVSLGLDTVKTVLTYHIVAGPPISYRAALHSDGADLETLQGGTVEVDVRRFLFFRYIKLIDLDPDDANPLVVDPEVGGRASNGYAHGITRVLRPVDL